MEECLSKQTSSCIKGIMAICVLLHHIYLTSNMTFFLPLRMLFQCFGYLADLVVPLKCIRGEINRKCVDVLDRIDFLKM